MRMTSRLLPVAIVALAAVVGACKGGSDPTGPDSLFTEVVITPSTGNVSVGGTLQLNAAISGPPGTPQGVTWKAVDPDFATVSANGLVTGVAGGTARIRATWVQDSTNFTDAHITVTDVPVTEEGAGTVRRRLPKSGGTLLPAKGNR
jgi:hypothetical protein